MSMRPSVTPFRRGIVRALAAVALAHLIVLPVEADAQVRRPGGSPLPLSGLTEVVVGNDPIASIDAVAAGFLDARLALFTARGTLLVADDELSIREFSETGELLRSFGGRGRGPGEFLALTALATAANDTLLVLDNRLRRISVWSSGGTIERTIPLQGNGLCCSPSGWYLEQQGSVAERDDGYTQAPFAVRWWRAGDAPPASAATVPFLLPVGPPRLVAMLAQEGQGGFSFGAVRRVPFQAEPMIALVSSGVVSTIGRDDQLRLFGLDQRVLAASVPLQPAARLSQAAWRASRDSVLETVPSSRERRSLAEAFGRVRAPERYPTFDRVLRDPASGFWLRVADEGADELQAWIHFDETLRALGLLRIPGHERLLAIRGRRLAVAIMDAESGDVRVEVRRLGDSQR